MPLVKCPYVGCLHHGRGQIVTGSFVQGSLGVDLVFGPAQVIAAEVRCVPGQVVAILVIDDSCVVRGVGPVRSSRGLDQRAVSHQPAAGAEVDLSIGVNRIVLNNSTRMGTTFGSWKTIVSLRCRMQEFRLAARTREPIMTALEWPPLLCPAKSIPDSVPLGSGVMRIDDDRHRRERSRP